MQHMKYVLMTLMMSCVSPAFADDTPSHQTWIDDTHADTKRLLNRTARHMDGWFGTTDPNDPARASIRVMLDTHHNDYDGTTIKPRVRAKVKLPTLENRLSVMIGDDDLDLERGGGIHNDGRIVTYGSKTLDRHQAKEDNSSLALRWSHFQEYVGIETDADIGLRSDDIYLKLRAQKQWEFNHDINGRFEQVYRYGSKSEHYALSTLEFSQPQSQHRTLINRTQLAYTHQDQEKTTWSNSFYQQHDLSSKHGRRAFSYGIYAGGDFDNKSPHLNTYGPYVSYRQPVWRKWLFFQTDVSYYNDKNANRDHHLGVFNRLEVQF